MAAALANLAPEVTDSAPCNLWKERDQRHQGENKPDLPGEGSAAKVAKQNITTPP